MGEIVGACLRACLPACLSQIRGRGESISPLLPVMTLHLRGAKKSNGR